MSNLTTTHSGFAHVHPNPWKFLRTEPPSVGIIGVPFHGGQDKVGVDQGPARMLSAGLGDGLARMGWAVSMDSDFERFVALNPVSATGAELSSEQEKLRNAWNVAQATQHVADYVQQTLVRGRFALTLGGDHSVAIGTVCGTRHVFGDDFCVVWVDAHGDINTPKTTLSGNLHGCVVSFLLGLDRTHDVPDFEWLRSHTPVLRPDQLVYIGLRDLDPDEKRLIRQLNIPAYTMYDIDRHGIGNVMEMAMQAVNPNGTRPIHLSFDVDALDPSEVPSTGTPVRGGMTFREAHFLTEFLGQTGLLVAMDLMEVNPCLGDAEAAERTVRTANSLVRGALGENLL